MIAVRDRLDALDGTLPVVITFTADSERHGAYAPYLGIDFPVLADPARELYALLGAGRASIARVWSMGTIAMYARLLKRGRRLRVPIEDTRQLGADALIDSEGRLQRLWLPDGPDARPATDEIVTAIRELD